MDKTASASILKLLRTIYPHTYKAFTKEDSEIFINLWAEMFDEPSAIVIEAFKAVLSRKKDFAPSIADVKEKILEMTMPDAFMTEEEAWAKVYNCLSNSSNGASDSFDKFPDILKKLVGKPSQLREWGMMDTGQLNTVVKSNFVRSYREKARIEREILVAPKSVKLMALQAQKALAEGRGDLIEG